MKSPRLRLAIAALAFLGLALLGIFFLRKEITLVVNGKSQEIRTYALTVDHLLGIQGIALAPGDALQPPLNSWLKDKDQIKLDRAVPVTIKTGGRVVQLLTPDRVPADLLALASLSLQPGDVVLWSGIPVPSSQPLPRANAYQLNVKRAVAIVLQTGGETQTITTTADSLGQALWQAGIRLHAGDLLEPPGSTPLDILSQPVLHASLRRSQVLTVKADGRRISIRSAAATVGEALAEAGFSVQGMDFSQPAEDEPLPADGRIRIIRVQEDVLIEQTPLPYKTVTQAADDVEIDTQKVIQAGVTGMTARRIRVRLEDGKEVSRQIETEWVAVPPKDRIIGLGRMVVMHTLNTPDGTIKYWRVLTMYATSYRPSDTGDTTATGLPLKKGVAAVDTRIIPFYTRLYIPGYGKAVAADRGGGVIGRWIDLGYSDSDYKPWHQWVKVYFLWPPPDNIVWTIP